MVGARKEALEAVCEKLLSSHAFPASHDIESITSTLSIQNGSDDEGALIAMQTHGLVEMVRHGHISSEWRFTHKGLESVAFTQTLKAPASVLRCTRTDDAYTEYTVFQLWDTLHRQGWTFTVVRQGCRRAALPKHLAGRPKVLAHRLQLQGTSTLVYDRSHPIVNRNPPRRVASLGYGITTPSSSRTMHGDGGMLASQLPSQLWILQKTMRLMRGGMIFLVMRLLQSWCLIPMGQSLDHRHHLTQHLLQHLDPQVCLQAQAPLAALLQARRLAATAAATAIGVAEKLQLQEKSGPLLNRLSLQNKHGTLALAMDRMHTLSTGRDSGSHGSMAQDLVMPPGRCDAVCIQKVFAGGPEACRQIRLILQAKTLKQSFVASKFGVWRSIQTSRMKVVGQKPCPDDLAMMLPTLLLKHN